MHNCKKKIKNEIINKTAKQAKKTLQNLLSNNRIKLVPIEVKYHKNKIPLIKKNKKILPKN